MKIGPGKIALLIAASGALIIGGWTIGTSNREVRLRNQVEAQQEANQSVFDRTWKIIQQNANVASEYTEQFKESYSDIMDSSSGGNTRLLAFIQSVNPQYDTALFANLQTSIEANRRDFDRVQQRLIDLRREHNNLLETFPTGMILTGVFGRQPVEIQIVTSSRTEEAFETGTEDDVSLFGNK